MIGERTDLQTAVLETTWGAITIVAGDRGVLACRLPKASAKKNPVRVLRVRLPRKAKPCLRRAADFVQASVAGRKPGQCPRLDEEVVAEAPEFRRAIWAALQEIPRGRTVSYSELAGLAGRPRAARSAGSACGANPWPLFIPCHRALAAGGHLGGFSAGLAWKIHLLSGEGVRR